MDYLIFMQLWGMIYAGWCVLCLISFRSKLIPIPNCIYQHFRNFKNEIIKLCIYIYVYMNKYIHWTHTHT